jgi:hypothetical protein
MFCRDTQFTTPAAGSLLGGESFFPPLPHSPPDSAYVSDRVAMKLSEITTKWEAVGHNQLHTIKTLRPISFDRASLRPKGGHMKRQVMMALTMLSLIVTLAVTSAKAQSRSHFMRINIPFEFIIRGETLPPGAYTVKRASSDKPETLLLSSADGGSRLNILTNIVRANTRQTESKLVFHQYGDQYFLSQIWEAGDNEGRQLSASRQERSTARGLAKDTMKRQTVTLIAQR